MSAGDNIVKKLVVRHLDGVSLLDSFDVYINETLVGSFDDVTQIQTEVWVTTEFDISSYDFTGDLTIRFRATDDIWTNCPTYGQVAIDWVSVYGCEPVCGNGILELDEVCDGDEPQACTTGESYDGFEICTDCLWSECLSEEYCGDSITNGLEDCDDGSEGSEFCTSNCTSITPEPFCGDAILES